MAAEEAKVTAVTTWLVLMGACKVGAAMTGMRIFVTTEHFVSSGWKPGDGT
jgi:hypothetical protein